MTSHESDAGGMENSAQTIADLQDHNRRLTALNRVLI